LNGIDVSLYRYVDVSTYQIVVKQTNFNWEMFNLFKITETLQNYFTCEVLPNYLSSKVALHLSKPVAAMFGGK